MRTIDLCGFKIPFIRIDNVIYIDREIIDQAMDLSKADSFAKLSLLKRNWTKVGHFLTANINCHWKMRYMLKCVLY